MEKNYKEINKKTMIDTVKLCIGNVNINPDDVTRIQVIYNRHEKEFPCYDSDSFKFDLEKEMGVTYLRYYNMKNRIRNRQEFYEFSSEEGTLLIKEILEHLEHVDLKKKYLSVQKDDEHIEWSVSISIKDGLKEKNIKLSEGKCIPPIEFEDVMKIVKSARDKLYIKKLKEVLELKHVIEQTGEYSKLYNDVCNIEYYALSYKVDVVSVNYFINDYDNLSKCNLDELLAILFNGELVAEGKHECVLKILEEIEKHYKIIEKHGCVEEPNFMKIKLIKGDITTANVDAIVNAANSSLLGGAGVCGAIFKAAGWDKLQKECDKIGHCDVGNAVATPAGNLNAKCIIHAVGPRYQNDNVSAPLLEATYYNSLKVAEENGCKSIAFPAISTGIFGYPLEKATDIAKEILASYVGFIDECHLYCYDEETYAEYKKHLQP